MAKSDDTQAKQDLEKAASEVESQLSGEKKPAQATEETIETTEDEEAASTEGSEEDELSETELVEARNLYKALKDPKTSSAVISALAHQTGILSKVPPAAGRETTEAKKDIRDLLKEGLGTEYAFLADRLGPAIEKVLEQEREEHESRLEEVRRTGIEANVVSAFDRLARETKGESRKLEAKMTQLSEEIPIGPGMSIDRYLKVLFTQARQEVSLRDRTQRINRNATDASARLSATASGSRSEVPSGKMKLDKAIEWATNEIAKQGR